MPGNARPSRGWTRNTLCRGGSAAITLARAEDYQLDNPRVGAAVLAAEVTPDQAAEIALGLRRVLRRVPARHRDAITTQATDVLLDLARDGVAPTDLRRAADRIALVTDQDGASESQMAAHLDQTLELTRVGDRIRVAGWLDLDAGAALLTVLDPPHRRLAPRRLHRTRPRVRPRHRRGRRPAHGPPDRRLPTPLRTQVVYLARPAARCCRPSPSVRSRSACSRTAWSAPLAAGRPHLTVTGTLRDLTDYLRTTRQCDAALDRASGAQTDGDCNEDGVRAPGGTGSALHLPGTDTPVPIPVSTLTRIGCDSELTLILSAEPPPGPAQDRAAPPGEPHQPDDLHLGAEWGDRMRAALEEASRTILFVGRTERTVTRRAVVPAGQPRPHLRVPRLHRKTPVAARPHHIRWWRDGGTTDPDNLVLLCGRHHRLVHEGGWKIIVDPCGAGELSPTFRFVRPRVRDRGAHRSGSPPSLE